MADPVPVDALVRLFRADSAALEEAHTNVRVLLRQSGPRYGTSEYEQYWRECGETVRAVAVDEARRCDAMSPPDVAGAWAVRRRMRQALEQMYEPESVKKAKEAGDLEAWKQFQADQKERAAAFCANRRARGLPDEPMSGEAKPPVFIHRLPAVDFWAGLEETEANFAAVVAAEAAAKARENDANLGDLPLGHSRIGGVPDLPPDVVWPTVEGKKVPFIAQL